LAYTQSVAFKERHKLIAIDAFSRYSAYLAAGFNESQAMSLTMLYKP